MKGVTLLSVIFTLASLFMVGIVGLNWGYAQEINTVAGLWLFDEGDDDIAFDSSENKSDGQLMGDPKWVEGKFGKALKFDGVADWVKVPTSDALKATNKALTCECWVYPLSNKTGNILEVNENSGWRLRYRTSDGLKFYDRANTNALEVFGIVPLDTWTHVAVTGDSDGLKLYANGEKVGEKADRFAPGPGDDHLAIGTADSLGEYFEGVIDEVRVLNIALTQDEIQDSMRGLGVMKAVQPSDKLAVVWGQI